MAKVKDFDLMSLVSLNDINKFFIDHIWSRASIYIELKSITEASY